jgi:hypothetical protein
MRGTDGHEIYRKIKMGKLRIKEVNSTKKRLEIFDFINLLENKKILRDFVKTFINLCIPKNILNFERIFPC